MRIVRTFLLTLPIVFVGFFIAQTATASSHIVINEIQIGGTTSTDEFIELYNPTAQAVTLTGWRLSRRTASGTESNLLTTFPDVTLNAGATYVVGHANFAGNPDARYSTQNSIASNNTVVLYSDAGNTVVDLVGMGDATISEGSTAPNPDNGQSISRTNGADTDNNSTDFTLTTPSPGSTTTTPPADDPIDPPPSPLPTPSPSGGGTGNTAPSFASNSVMINELVSDPTDNEEEWIELLNTTTQNIDLKDWAIEDGTAKPTTLAGQISAGGFFIITKLPWALNNTGDTVVLRGPNGQIISSVTYGNWNDGNLDDNAPVASDPNSLSRTTDGSFVITTPTRGQPNNSSTTDQPTPTATNGDVRINELLPNPLGSDINEWIELYNSGKSAVDLTGWRMEDGDGQSYTFPNNTSILREGYLVLSRRTTGIALDNSGGETVRLYKPKATRATSITTYKGTAEDGLAWALIENDWQWTPTITAGALNQYTPPNRPPVITLYSPTKVEVNEQLVLSAEDTFDIEGDEFELIWDLGNGDTAVGDLVFYSYPRAGVYSVKLTARQTNGTSATENITITVGTPTATVAGASDSTITTDAEVWINEILPRPSTGNDEWIELYNPNNETVSLRGWTLSDERTTYALSQTIQPFSYLLLTKADTKIALNNDGDTVTLKNALGDEVNGLAYDEAEINTSYTRTHTGAWVWTTPTPLGANNVLAGPMGGDPDETFVLSGEVEIEGVVTAGTSDIEPTVIYVGALSESGGGIRVDLPDGMGWEMARGDRVRVKGTVRNVAGEPRMTVAAVEDISFVSNGDPLSPIELYEEDARLIGELVTVRGTIDKGSSAGFALTYDGGMMRVVVPKSLTPKRPYPTGTEVTVTGLLSKTSAGFRIMTRDAEDVKAIVSTPDIIAPPTSNPAPWYLQSQTILIGGIAFIALAAFYALQRYQQQKRQPQYTEEEIDF